VGKRNDKAWYQTRPPRCSTVNGRSWRRLNLWIKAGAVGSPQNLLRQLCWCAALRVCFERAAPLKLSWV